MHRTSSATLGLMLITFIIWSFRFQFMRKPTPAWPLFALEWYTKWPLYTVVKHSSGLLTSEIPIISYTNQVCLSSYLRACICSSLSRVLTL